MTSSKSNARLKAQEERFMDSKNKPLDSIFQPVCSQGLDKQKILKISKGHNKR
jgi:hypothetical protein